MQVANQINIVFTGPAFDKNGRQVFREDLKKIAEAQGYVVQSSVRRDTHAVIASRTDTVKAARAQAAGLLVSDYPSFIDSLGGAVPQKAESYKWIVDGLKIQPQLDPNADYL